MSAGSPHPPEVSVSEAAAAVAGGAPLIDVREVSEFEEVRVPEAVSIPLGDVLGRANELDRDRRLYVICAVGGRSLAATEALRKAGFDAVSVSGGTNGWALEGREVVRGPASS